MPATTTAAASREVGSRIAVVVKYVAYVALPVHVVLLATFALPPRASAPFCSRRSRPRTRAASCTAT